MENFNYLIILLFSDILILFLFFALKNQKRNQITTCFYTILVLMFIWTLSLTLQILFQNKIRPVLFEYMAAFGAEFIPVAFLSLGLIFSRTKIIINKKFLLLLIIPIVSLLLMLTNDFHHLYYVTYSTSLSETIYGPYMTVHSIFSYTLFALTLILLLKYSIKNAGFFSKQALLIILGALIPIVANIIGYLGILPITVYITPICFSFTIMFFALAIFKFKFLSITPIAMQRIVDRMSDSFMVVSEDGIITDFNETFLKTFHLSSDEVRNVNFVNFINKQNLEGLNKDLVKPILEKSKITEETILVKREMKILDHYFNIEASGIFSKGTFLGTLILLKDVTQHMRDMQTIQDNQNMLMERERLASLGQLIGGIAHNLKTPIMSISGAAEGLTDLTTEYEKSVGDSEVTIQDHHEIAHDMKDWIEKIRSYTEYMSDVITAVKGQAVTMSEEQAVSFTLDELVKRVNILMRHELKNALVDLNIQMKAEPDTILKGNINSLVQVINNMVSNAIQAYNGEVGHEINLILEPSGKNIIISIQDFANGLPESVASKLFKEMITTKGKNGTGLGLFMSYSTIRAHFNGNVTFETEKGKGTVFHISLPV